jgi:putative Holliday junction resolvase
MKMMSHILALDYGAKRTGVAKTDEAKIFAFGIKTVETKELWSFLEYYFQNNKVEKLVIGEPKRLNNEATHATTLVLAFVREFNKKYPNIPVVQVDERFTSKIAAQSMIEMGLKKSVRQQKERVDEISAVLILQSYLSQIEMNKFFKD